MSRQVGAVALVLIVAGAPAALTTCEIACSAHESQSSSSAETHSCHGIPQPSDAPVVGNGAHVCGHESEMPAAAKTTPSVAYVPLIDVVPFLATGRAGCLLPRSDTLAIFFAGSSKPLTPLRI